MPGFRTASYFQVEGTQQPDREKTLTFDQPVGNLPIVDDSRWSAAFTDHSLAALLVWIMLLVVLQAVTWPLVQRLFTRFPDRGWAFARLTTLLFAGFTVWFLASIHVITFRAAWAIAALIALGAVSWILSRRIEVVDDMRPFWRNPIIIGAEVVFWSVFALFLLFRLINPDSYHPVWGGEKPMEFAHLNAILRSAHFPPVDPWYSGGYINYYYYGTYLVAFMIKVTGIPVEIAFNLAQPTFPALLAAGAFSVTAALGKRLTRSTTGAVLTGALGAFFIQFAGNLVVAERVLDRALNGLGPVNDFSYWVFNPTRAIPGADRPINITEFPYFGALYADLHPHVIAMPFTVLMIALAWQTASLWRLLPIALSRRPNRPVFPLAAPLVTMALGLGTLFMTNAWDMPMYAVVTAVGVFMATRGLPSVWRRLGVSALALCAIGIVAFICILPFTTYYVALFGEIATVRDRTPLLAIQSHLGAQLLLVTLGIAALTIPRSGIRLTHMSVHFTVSIVLLAAALLIQWLANEKDSPLIRLAEFVIVAVVASIWLVSAWSAIRRRGDFNAHPIFLRTEVVHAGALIVILLALQYTTIALYLGIGLAAAILWLALRAPSERFIMALIAGGTFLGASLELVYLVDDLSGSDWYRMNTIFKFYNQIWILLGVATAALIGHAVWTILQGDDTRRDDQKAFSPNDQISSSPSLWHWLGAGLLVPVAIASLAYAFVATPIRLNQHWIEGGGDLTLNAYQWMEYGEIPLIGGGSLSYDDDLVTINWLNENVSGTPVIAEASFGPYRCNGSRFSIATGLPAVIGWQRHQQQQRYLDDLGTREADLRELYTTPDIEAKQGIIDRYGIEYIIVGETERRYPSINGNDCVDSGSSEGIGAIEDMTGSALEVAFEHGNTTVYRVIRP